MPPDGADSTTCKEGYRITIFQHKDYTSGSASPSDKLLQVKKVCGKVAYNIVHSGTLAQVSPDGP